MGYPTFSFSFSFCLYYSWPCSGSSPEFPDNSSDAEQAISDKVWAMAVVRATLILKQRGWYKVSSPDKLDHKASSELVFDFIGR
jgi:hypothetical protein